MVGLGEASAGYTLAKPLLKAGIKPYRNWTKTKAKKAMAKAQAGYQNPFLAEYLNWKYPDKTLLKFAGHEYPVAIFEPAESQFLKPESVLLRPLLRSGQLEEALLPGSAKYRALRYRLDVRPGDRPCFTMLQILNNENLLLKCELGTYLAAIDTCDEFAWELLVQHESLKGSSLRAKQSFDNRLKFRNHLHSLVDDPVIDGSLRNAAVAISVLIAFWDGNDLYLLVRRRSESVVTHPNMVHVLPSCMFQPATTDLDNEYSIEHNSYREYLEELFSRKEPEAGEGAWNYFYQDRNLMFLKSLIDEGKAQLHFTGVAVNLLNLRPEVCLLLYIKSESWWQHHSQNADPNCRFRFNWEFMSVTDMIQHPQGASARLKFIDDDEEMLESSGVQPHEFAPPGAAALCLGHRRLVDLL